MSRVPLLHVMIVYAGNKVNPYKENRRGKLNHIIWTI